MGEGLVVPSPESAMFTEDCLQIFAAFNTMSRPLKMYLRLLYPDGHMLEDSLYEPGPAQGFCLLKDEAP